MTWLSLCGAVWLAGCGGPRQADYSELKLVDVRGTVTLDGRPLADAHVIFEAADRSYSCGRTDASGRYHLMLNSEKSGVVPGVKTVRIRTAGAGDREEATAREGEEPAAGNTPESVPACYNANSQLQVTVEGSTQTLDFSLTSDGSARAGP